MAKAWDQVRDVDRANEALRRMQLSLLANRRLCNTRVDPRTAPSTAQLCRPAASRLPFTVGSPGTLAERLADSPLPVAALDSAYAKVAMRAARRARLPAAGLVAELRTRMLGEEAVLAPPQGELAPRDFSDPGAVRSALAESGGLARLVAGSGTTVEQTFDAVDELPALLAAITAAPPEPAPPAPPAEPAPHHGPFEVHHDLDLHGGGAHVTQISPHGQAWLDQATPVLDAVRESIALPAGGARARAELGERLSAAGGRSLATADRDSLLARRIGLVRPEPNIDINIGAAVPDAMA